MKSEDLKKHIDDLTEAIEELQMGGMFDSTVGAAMRKAEIADKQECLRNLKVEFLYLVHQETQV